MDYQDGRLTLSIGWPIDDIQPDIEYEVSIKIGKRILQEFTVPYPPTYVIINLYHYSYAATNRSLYIFFIDVCETSKRVCARKLELVWDLFNSQVNPMTDNNTITTSPVASAVDSKRKFFIKMYINRGVNLDKKNKPGGSKSVRLPPTGTEPRDLYRIQMCPYILHRDL